MIILLAHILVLLAMSYMLWKNERNEFRKLFWPALIIKLLGGIGLGLVYKYYYSVGDTFGYFHDAVVLADLARQDFYAYLSFLWNGNESYSVWEHLYFINPRALFLSKIASVVSLISLDNYWIIASYFSFISFCSAWFLVRTISRFYRAAKIPAVIAFLFFPSVVFWTSGLIKESLAVAGIYFLSIIILQVWNHSKVFGWQWALALFSAWIVWALKYYYFAVFIAVAFAALVMRLLIIPYLKPKSKWVIAIIWFAVFLIPLFIVSLVHPNFYPEHFLEVIVSNYQAFAAISDPAEMIHYANLEPNVLSIIQYSPKALFSGIFRPFIWETDTAFQFLIALENTFLFLLFTISIIRFNRVLQSTDKLLWFSIVVYVVLLSVFLSLSTPNFGTLSRYRVGFLPFFALLVLWNNPIVMVIDRFLRR